MLYIKNIYSQTANSIPTPISIFWAKHNRHIEILSGIGISAAGAQLIASSMLLTGTAVSAIGIALIVHGVFKKQAPKIKQEKIKPPSITISPEETRSPIAPPQQLRITPQKTRRTADRILVEAPKTPLKAQKTPPVVKTKPIKNRRAIKTSVVPPSPKGKCTDHYYDQISSSEDPLKGNRYALLFPHKEKAIPSKSNPFANNRFYLLMESDSSDSENENEPASIGPIIQPSHQSHQIVPRHLNTKTDFIPQPYETSTYPPRYLHCTINQRLHIANQEILQQYSKRCRALFWTVFWMGAVVVSFIIHDIIESHRSHPRVFPQ